MSEREIDKLHTLDLSKISLSDVMKLDNPAMRAALSDVIRRGGLVDLVVRPEHTSHGMHTNHLMEPPKIEPLDQVGQLQNPRPQG